MSGLPRHRAGRPGAALLLVLGLAAVPAGAETLRPLVTEDVDTLADGILEVQVALEAETDYHSPTRPLSGAIVRAPILGLNFGLGGRTEVQLRAPLRQHFDPQGEPAGRDATGDFTLATKVRFFGGRGVVPGLGARVQVKLPNIGETTGIGTDETDVTLELLAGIDLGGAQVATSLGLAILGDPSRNAAQNDKLVLGAGFFLPLGLIDVGADLHGLVLGDHGRASEWTALAAAARRFGPVRLDAAVGFRERDDDRSFLFTAGLTAQLALRR